VDPQQAGSDGIVSVVSPAPRDVWLELFRASDDSLVSQSPSWFDALLESGHRDASRLYTLRSGRRLVLPLARSKRPGSTNASLPAGWGIGGLVASGHTLPSDVAAVAADPMLASTGPHLIKPGPLAAAAWAVALPAAAGASHSVHILDLAGGHDMAWDRFGSDTRKMIRRAERAGVVVESGNSARLIEAFHELYDRWLDERARRLHRPPALQRWSGRRNEPPARLDLLARRLGDRCQQWVAFVEGQPAAALVTFIDGSVAVNWRSTMSRERSGKTQANYLLQAQAIEHAARAGCRLLQMGESGGVSGIEGFKERFGAVKHPYLEYNLGGNAGLAARLRRLAGR
jgi:hypothetical protein